MVGSSDSNKRKGDDDQDGESGGNKLQKATMAKDMFHCSICSKRQFPPIFKCSERKSICSPCRDELPESERAETRPCKSMDRVVQNLFFTKGMALFDCSICSKPLGPPIFQCSKGNPICSPCRNKLPEREQATAQRCNVMERVVDNIFVPCKYRCNSMPTYYRKDNHERDCELGPFVCPVSGCGLVATFRALLDHLTTLHKLPKTWIEFFVPSKIPIKTGSRLLCSKFCCLFLLDLVSLDSLGHAVYIVCVRPETPLNVAEVLVQFSRSGHLQVSKLEISADDEPRQYLCVLPSGETDAMFSIEIRMLYIANDEVEKELQWEEEEEEDDEDYKD